MTEKLPIGSLGLDEVKTVAMVVVNRLVMEFSDGEEKNKLYRYLNSAFFSNNPHLKEVSFEDFESTLKLIPSMVEITDDGKIIPRIKHTIGPEDLEDLPLAE